MTDVSIPPVRTWEVRIPASGLELPGVLTIPSGLRGAVVFSHGSGSTHTSPRNAAVAKSLETQGFATLRFDLLAAQEASDRSNVFDVEPLATRLVKATTWLISRPELVSQPVGLFGASTGAAAALIAAARLPSVVVAVVSRGGRPDLAGVWLPLVKAPTLLLVGQYDEDVLDLNRGAAAQLTCYHRLSVIDGASHLFEEPGCLEEVARQASAWFGEYLRPTAAPRRGNLQSVPTRPK